MGLAIIKEVIVMEFFSIDEMTMVNNGNSISLHCYVAPNKFETNAYCIHI